MKKLSRRRLLQRTWQVAATLVALPAGLGAAAAAETCVNADSESLRTSLHYANASPKSGELCKGCGFFGADAAKAACGNCQIMSGPVDAGGHCDSWAAKG